MSGDGRFVSDINTTSDVGTIPDAGETQGAQRSAVGVLLRDTRMSQGLDIADVARALRISQRYLEALEKDRDQDLPGPTYAIGFIRSYSEHLGLDSEEIVHRYKVGADVMEVQSDLVFPKPISDGGVPGAVVLGLGVIIAAVAYGGWYWHSSADALRVAQVDPVPGYLSTSPGVSVPHVSASGITQVPAPKSSNLGIETLADGTPVAALVREHAAKDQITTKPKTNSVAAEHVQNIVNAPKDKGVRVAQNNPEPQNRPQAAGFAADMLKKKTQTTPVVDGATASQPVSGTNVPQPSAAEIALVDETPRIPASAKGSPSGVGLHKATTVVSPVPSVSAVTHPSRITVQAISNSWIQIRDEVANRLLFTRLLRRGDSYKVPDRPGLRMMTGNAGALEIIVDGKIVPSLGAVGEVRRDVELDPDKLKSGTSVTN